MRARDARGFSLIELLLAVAILSIVVWGASHMLHHSERATLEAAARQEADQQIGEVLGALRTDLLKRRTSIDPSTTLALPTRLLDKPFIDVAACDTPGQGVPCHSLVFARTYDDVDRFVRLDATCRDPPAGTPAGFDWTRITAPCSNVCTGGKIPALTLTRRDGPQTFPKGTTMGATKLLAMSACATVPVVPINPKKVFEVHLDIGAAYVNQGGQVVVLTRSVAVPLESTLGSSITLSQ